MHEPAIAVRSATEHDAVAMAHVHYSAVHETAVLAYPSAILTEWSPALNDFRYGQFRKAITGGIERFLVAEDPVGIPGFGSIVPSASELRSVYVHSRAARRGVGSAILKALEDLAGSFGCLELQLLASINSEAFYSRHGYTICELAIHKLSSGLEMACVKMRKTL
jgi:putative acetyltransferase